MHALNLRPLRPRQPNLRAKRPTVQNPGGEFWTAATRPPESAFAFCAKPLPFCTLGSPLGPIKQGASATRSAQNSRVLHPSARFPPPHAKPNTMQTNTLRRTAKKTQNAKPSKSRSSDPFARTHIATTGAKPSARDLSISDPWPRPLRLFSPTQVPIIERFTAERAREPRPAACVCPRLGTPHSPFHTRPRGSPVATVSKPKTKNELISGADILVQSLVNHGVDIIFAYPGGCSMPLHQALTRFSDQIRTILPRHEQGGAFAAQGYARSTGKAGVCMATSGPGATNLVTAIADAKLDSIPLIAITGQVPTHVIGTDAFQETPIVEVCRGITKHHYLVTDVNDIARVVKEAFHHRHHRPARPGADRHAEGRAAGEDACPTTTCR